MSVATGRGKRTGGQRMGLLYAGIPLIGFALFSLVPAAISLVISLGDMNGYFLNTLRFTGFDNYIAALRSADFWKSLGVSFYAMSAQFISLFTAIVIATFLSRNLKGSGFFSVLFFIPYICSSVAVSFMWKRMFNPDYGVINTLLHSDFNWFYSTSPNLFMPMLIVVIVWQAAGYGIVVLNAALVSVDRSLYEAAEVDGAGGVRQFFSITLPQIRQTIYFLAILGIVNGLQTFDVALIFSGDPWTGVYGPDNMGKTLMLSIYKEGTLNQNMPYAAAMSWLLFLVILGVRMICDATVGRKIEND